MHSFHYSEGTLACEGVNLKSLAEEHGTPLYVYSHATISSHYTRLSEAFSSIDSEVCYAVKANSNIAILNMLAKAGAGFDIVSGGELFRVIKAGGDPSKCTFAGVGKTEEEITYALEQGVYSFNVESQAELRYINEVAGNAGKIAPVALRVNPNVDAKTHKYISTGKSENKFGIDFDQIEEAYRSAEELEHLKIRGIQMHIGSQLTTVNPFAEAVDKVLPLVESLKEKHAIEFFSIGGGIGIIYEDSLASGEQAWWDAKPEEERPMTVDRYAAELLPRLKKTGLRILLEPGRFMVGNAGVLLTQVLYEKRGTVKRFKIIDAGMNDLIRPALYEGHHDIVPVLEKEGNIKQLVDVVGPICESGDFFAQAREIPAVEEGEYLAVMSAGAYAFTMASNYNSRPLPAEILIKGSEAIVIRQRQTYEDLISGEVVPS